MIAILSILLLFLVRGAQQARELDVLKKTTIQCKGTMYLFGAPNSKSPLCIPRVQKKPFDVFSFGIDKNLAYKN